METVTHNGNHIEARTSCRVCGSAELESVVDLGNLALTGVFPRSVAENVPRFPVVVALCGECGLAQTMHDVPPMQLYGDNYGYRSGLNQSMVENLRGITKLASRLRPLQAGDVVCDIGSNDGTLLSGYRDRAITRIGIDPTAQKFLEFYEPNIEVASDFFSRELYAQLSDKKAKVITSIAMLYDLPDPKAFFSDVASVLDSDGIWISEQSYAPWMLRSGAFDTICHEHLEYYTLHNLVDLANQNGLRVTYVSTNETNGGSLRLIFEHKKDRANDPLVCDFGQWLLMNERSTKIGTSRAWKAFDQDIRRCMGELESLLDHLTRSGRRVGGLGASTKGNVLLQLIPDARTKISCIGEVNSDKYGRWTPGTLIPITSQDSVLRQSFDYLLILPWHFKQSMISALQPQLDSGVRLIFPLPQIEVF